MSDHQMKNTFSILLIILISSISIAAQSSTKTIVLVRHAEKAASTEMDKTGDVDLSAEGKERAARLMKIVKRYKPHEIFATDYKRTKQTVEPIAAYRKKQIQIYDPTKQPEFIQKILSSNTDHYLIAGHSNTIPALANLLTKKEVFRQMPDNEFGVIWVIRFKNGALTRVEIFTY